MKLIFRGGAQEVGRSCIEVQTEGDRYLLDCGVKFTEEGFAYPEGIFDVPDLDGVFLSHAHLDHSGGLPFFEHHDLRGPIFCTAQTRLLTRILLKDSFEVARIRHLHPAFSKVDLKEVKKDTHTVGFDRPFKHRKLTATFFNAGHIPGSASILLELEGKRLLYSGDINTRPGFLMEEAKPDYGPVDVLIVESTYGYRDLPPRKDVALRFLDRVSAVVDAGGSVLVPVFAVGRAQELLLALAQREFPVPLYFDGMITKVTRQMLSTPSGFIKDKDVLARMFFEKVKSPKSEAERNDIAQRPGIFITTSGMLQGGPVMHYLKHMWHDQKNAVFLTGYQCKRTNGRELLDTGFINIKGWRTKVLCQVEQFEFSGHADRQALKEYIQTVNPKALVVQHGDPESVEAIRSWAETTLKIPVFGPKVGDELAF